MLITTLTISSSAASQRNLRAFSSASASGSVTVQWGNPSLSPSTAYGTGSESIEIRGTVFQRPDLPGYFVYDTIRLSGRLYAEWALGEDHYVLDASFKLRSEEVPMMPTTIVPILNSFAVMGMDFSATITMSGVSTYSTGIAAAVAAFPGLFSFNGQSRMTSVILYDSPVGQVVLRWSETTQLIDGTTHLEADSLEQTIRLREGGGRTNNVPTATDRMRV